MPSHWDVLCREESKRNGGYLYFWLRSEKLEARTEERERESGKNTQMGFESEEIHEMGSDGNGLYLLHVAPES